ncbi:EamA family transporter RarD [Neobacillus sp. PS3-12]|jgi:chloramphenicol-sensitive protein RarD|uniref:EamA family transporter RarD n=1 Tax=Neobacillus sp. PS3-12 TaxID=3070677 RepID=UPI0027E112E4|nr:EamA family transporter RarD [Neobacillus sp. PS3-12]WML53506.1 EamA family transporter RarD [Neobacillus sp. PS3-12]
MNQGYWYAIVAYTAWGLLPIYWKIFSKISAWEILSQRIIWSVVFVVLLVLASKKWDSIKKAVPNWNSRIRIIISSLLIASNWTIYIWAVNNGHMIEASLGYYINPLVSVLLGVFFLGERLKSLQWGAMGVALVGVLILTINYGQFPWIALSLAITFGLYGLAKKKIKAEPLAGLTLETIVVFPLALLYLLIFQHGGKAWFVLSWWQMIALLLAGIATALPLLWFAEAAKRLPLSIMGFFQYLAPTITLLLGLFLYQESFSEIDLISFGCIWIAIVIYSSQMIQKKTPQQRLNHSKAKASI